MNILQSISDRLTEKSTWKGIFTIVGLAGGGSFLALDGDTLHGLTAAFASMGGGIGISQLINIFTPDFKKTPTKLDDYANAAANGFLDTFKK